MSQDELEEIWEEDDIESAGSLSSSSSSHSFFYNHKKKILSVGGFGVLAVGIWAIGDHLAKNPERANEIRNNFMSTITDPKYGSWLAVAVIAIIVTGCYLLCRERKQDQKDNYSIEVSKQEKSNCEEQYFEVDLTDLIEGEDERITHL